VKLTGPFLAFILVAASTACLMRRPMPPPPAASPAPVRGSAIDGSQDPNPTIGAPGRSLPPGVTREQASIMPPAPTSRDGYQSTSFRYLCSYPFETGSDAKRLAAEIPPPIQGLDVKQMAVSGFMVPLAVTEKGVTEFVLGAPGMARSDRCGAPTLA
jgi:hypothetical protein